MTGSPAWRLLRQILFHPSGQDDRNIRLVFLDTLWTGIMTSGAGTFMAVFMARLGATSLQIGLLTSIPAVLGLAIALPAGAYVERQQNQVATVTIYRALYRAIFVLIALAPFVFGPELIAAILVLNTVQAGFKEIQGLAYFSVVAAVVPQRQRPMINGVRWAAVSIVSAVAVGLFGRMLDVQGIAFPRNYQLLFGVTAVISFLALWSFARIRMPAAAGPTPGTGWGKHLLTLLRPVAQSPQFVRYLAGTSLLKLGMALPAALFSLFWINNLHAQDSIIGLKETFSGVALVAGYLIFGRLGMRRGNRAVLLLSPLGLALYPVATALSPNQFWLLPVAMLNGFFSSGISISLFEAVAAVAPPDKRPSFSALDQIVGSVASFAGPLLGAGLAAWLGIQAAFYISGALHVAGAALCWRLGVARASSEDGVAGTPAAEAAAVPVEESQK
jgi:MFS family permease